MASRELHRVILAAILLTSLSGCGYRLGTAGGDVGEGQTLGVPVFENLTTEFRIEQRLTAALRRELLQRTRYEVTPSAEGDVRLEGQVLGITSIPVILTEAGRGVGYTVTVDLLVRMTETSTGQVIFENPRWTFREVFELSNNSEQFVPEDTAAMERLARRFAESLVAALFSASI
jgi:hypothetical protein